MSYLPSGMPIPEPSPEDAPFWAACRERHLLIRHCNACQQFFHPPMPSCVHCGSTDVGWEQVAGTGTVFSYTVAHHAVYKALKGRGAYNIVVVLLDGAGDVRLVSNLVDGEQAEIRMDEAVTVVWDPVQGPAGEHILLPRFRRTHLNPAHTAPHNATATQELP